jgi:hypothetical protein
MLPNSLQSYAAADPKEIALQLIEAIPADGDHLSICDPLKQVCEILSDVDELTCVEIIAITIKRRFRMTNREIAAYQKLVSTRRREKQKTALLQGSHSTERVVTASFGALVDIVEHSGQPAFLVKDGGSISVQEEFNDGNRILVPPPRECFPFLLPRAEEVLRHYNQYSHAKPADVDFTLFQDIRAYLEQSADLSDPAQYNLVTCWILHTYVPEKSNFSPIIWLYAKPNRGKSRLGTAAISIAYRGIRLESVSAASLIRVSTDLHASLFLDVADP